MSIFDSVRDKLLSFTNSSGEQNNIETTGEDEKELVEWIKNKVEESKNNPSRITFENNVITNTAYVLGYDSVYFDSRTRQLRPYSGMAGYPARSRVHANLVLPTIQNRLSRLTKNPPKYDCRPETNDVESKDKARLTLKVINHVWDKERVNEKRIESTMWMQQAGHSWMKVYWDPMRGRQVPVPPEIDPMTGEGRPGKIEYEGDIGVDVCSPLEIYVDPLARNVQDAQWLIQAKVRKISYFRNQYGEQGQRVKPESAWLTSLQNLMKINNMSTKSQGGQIDQDMKDSAIEIAYYEKPSLRFPEGRMIVCANGVLLAYKDLPCGEINFVKFDDVKVGGKFYSESIITHIRPLQDQYNRNLRRKAEFLNKGLNLKWKVAKGHGLSEESLNDSTEVYQYNPVPQAKEPETVQAPQLPQYVYTDGETIKGDIGEVSGLSDVSKGEIPSASIPGIGMQILQEADETRMATVIESNENSWADVGRLIAKYARRYYKNTRYLTEAGQGGDYRVTGFTGEQLQDNPDVLVIKGSTVPSSKVLSRQDIINAHERGFFGPPQDPKVLRKVAEKLEFGDVQGIWEDQYIDDAQIKRSMEEIEQGILPQIHPDDNHQAHFEYKNRVRKSEKFLSYPPEIQQIFLQDFETHKQFIVQEVMAEAGPGAPMGEEIPMEEATGLEGTEKVDQAMEGL